LVLSKTRPLGESPSGVPCHCPAKSPSGKLALPPAALRTRLSPFATFFAYYLLQFIPLTPILPPCPIDSACDNETGRSIPARPGTNPNRYDRSCGKPLTPFPCNEFFRKSGTIVPVSVKQADSFQRAAPANVRFPPRAGETAPLHRRRRTLQAAFSRNLNLPAFTR
jgi:hypothetical protein